MKKKLFAMTSALMVLLCCFAGCSNSIYKHYDAAKYDEQFAEPEKGDTMARFVTNMGEFTVRLFPEAAPKAVENFVTHAEEGYYDGVIFHRVIEDFMVQSGDPTGRSLKTSPCPTWGPTGALFVWPTGERTPTAASSSSSPPTTRK